MSRRLRVTLAFTALLAVVLAAAGAVIHLRFAADLHRSQDRGLRAAVAALADAAERGGVAGTLPGGAGLAADEDVAQVVRPDGTVIAASAEGPVPLLTSAVRAAALRGPVLADRPGDARLDEGLRLAAVPVRVGGRPAVAVVGASSDEVHEAVVTLGRVEAVGLGAALLVGALGAWLLAGAVVRPVREALARERRFTADASHELRTPLTVLKAELEVGRMEGGDAEELRAVLRSAEEEVDRLSRLADDLLVLARADAGGLVLRRGDVAVDEVLARAARGRDGVAVAPSGLRVTGDDLRLEQAVGNLIDNALRHGAPPVEVGARREDGVVRIVVRDHGAGIPPDFLPRATERFSRPDGARSGGSGLGLAIVAAVARAHGGQVRLRSDGRETVAELELPTTHAKFG
ncbi:MAG TPA: HAMP domain-containing sensor histidine kinase [Miltoncostaea sp.]|nr:HAMP domain-containing sensor histidine kinase [Miltoncostaea sp.]